MGGPARPLPRAGSSRVRASASLPINTDYRYVVSDLKQIGILSAIAFAILGALTFFLS